MSDYTNELNAMRWSFSRCHGFEGCKYEWYLYYLEGKDNEQNFYAAFGKFCHKILEKVLKREITIESYFTF